MCLGHNLISTSKISQAVLSTQGHLVVVQKNILYLTYVKYCTVKDDALYWFFIFDIYNIVIPCWIGQG